ncbi:MAG: M23 family metallopeptidase [Bacteroidales bacterium]|nr:M23 family metallopeptidase [Bacteroidales bacterium]
MKKNNRVLAVFLTASFFFFFCAYGQSNQYDWTVYYGKPLAIEPLALSGSMGEFRATHLHTGYDFRVGGVVGAPVYAVADGYISRITVSPGGYGHALYVTHTNGTISLYGHLDTFSKEIAAYVKEEQYKRENFQLSLNCPPELFPVCKGQEIGKAGNTGNSAGPHLHFELRYKDPEGGPSWITANLLQHKIYEFEDTLPPEFRAVQLYGYSTGEHNVPQARLIAAFDGRVNRTATHVPDTFFVAVDAIDRMNHTWSRMGIETWEVFLDDVLVYRYRNKDLPLDKVRYILSLTHYPERAQKGRSLLKTWIEPGNRLADTDRIYAPSRGLFSFSDTLDHKLRIVVSDAAGNRSTRTFTLRHKGALEALVDRKTYGAEASSTAVAAQEYFEVFGWDRSNSFVAEGLAISMPEYALYKDILFRATRVDEREWILHTVEEPLHHPIEVQMEMPEDIPEELYNKVFVVRQSDNGRDAHMQEADPRLWRSTGGGHYQGMVTFRSQAFGRFRIALDTLAPSVSASFAHEADLRGRRSLFFTIKDNESGIDSYVVTIDGQWILGNYDAKRSRVTCLLEPERITRGTLHNVVVTVTDNKGNITAYNSSFLW